MGKVQVISALKTKLPYLRLQKFDFLQLICLHQNTKLQLKLQIKQLASLRNGYFINYKLLQKLPKLITTQKFSDGVDSRWLSFPKTFFIFFITVEIINPISRSLVFIATPSQLSTKKLGYLNLEKQSILSLPDPRLHQIAGKSLLLNQQKLVEPIFFCKLRRNRIHQKHLENLTDMPRTH